MTWLDNITMANSECNYLQVANGEVKPSSHLNARDCMEGPHPYFRLFCCSCSTKTVPINFPSLATEKQLNHRLVRPFFVGCYMPLGFMLTVFFVLGRWRNSGKRTKPSKKRFAQGSRPAFYMSNERMTT